MTNRYKGKRERPDTKGMSPYEAEAQAIVEKTARLKALRLAHEAATGTNSAPAVKRTAAKKKVRKPGEKAPALSEWLATQQKEGRRN